MTAECDPTTRYGPDTHEKRKERGQAATKQPLISDEQQMNKSQNEQNDG